MNLSYHIHTYLSSYLLQHIANESISVSFWGKTASLSASWGYVTPSVWLVLVSAINKLFVPMVHTSRIQPPPPPQLLNKP
jgi:hypothetical protein